MLRLHALTRRLLGANDVAAALHEVLDAAIELEQANFGDIHLLDEASGTLRLAAQRGLPEAYLAAFREIGAGHFSACGRALRSGQSVVIEDVEIDEAYAPMRQLAAETGYRAVHATPLTTHSGALLGVLSLHFRRRCGASRGALRMLDLYARQAGNVIERLQGEQRLRAAYQGRKHFVAVLAHELRGPLAAVQTAIEVLARPAIERWIHEQAIGIARRQLKQAAQLVDDLFELARLGESKLRLKRKQVAVADVVRTAIEASRRGIDASRIAVTITIDPPGLTASVDATRFAQVIANLLDNAAKFTPSDGSVDVDCREANGALVVEVRDTGAGMTPQTLARVFDAFEQSPEESDRDRGLGLGLPIAKRIVDLHGGTMTAHSDGPGAGSRFTIVVPGAVGDAAARDAGLHDEWLIDAAVEQSFPASDATSCSQPGSIVSERNAID